MPVRAAKPSLAYFLNGAALDSLEGHVLRLSFGAADRFAMNQVKNNRESVEAIAEAKYGWRLRLGCRRKEGRSAGPAGGEPARVRPPPCARYSTLLTAS